MTVLGATSRHVFRILRDPYGNGWVIQAEGHLTRSLPYETKKEAQLQAGYLCELHPGSRLIVTDEVALPIPDIAA